MHKRSLRHRRGCDKNAARRRHRSRLGRKQDHHWHGRSHRRRADAKDWLNETMKANAPNYIRIFDTTLRDGEQSPGVSLTLEDKMEIARQLSLLGVDTIGAGR